jgi:hypothetical protein
MASKHRRPNEPVMCDSVIGVVVGNPLPKRTRRHIPSAVLPKLARDWIGYSAEKNQRQYANLAPRNLSPAHPLQDSL